MAQDERTSRIGRGSLAVEDFLVYTRHISIRVTLKAINLAVDPSWIRGLPCSDAVYDPILEVGAIAVWSVASGDW